MKATKMLAILVLRSELLRRVALVVALALILCQAKVSEAAAMGTAFTYQGRLIDANSAAEGLYDFQFKLFDDPNVIVGTQVGDTIDINELDVIDGYFTVGLDFNDANAFNGNAVWLEIGVRPGDQNDPNVYTTLSPRQEITPTPYALQTRGIFVDNAGNVGIGTTGPEAKLHVYESSSSDVYMSVEASSSDGEAGIRLRNPAGGWDIFANDDDGDFGIAHALSDRVLTIKKTTGNVGIGTTSPAEKLEVAGNIKVSGAGNGVIFPDGTKQTTSVSGAAVPSGFCILGETATAPPGYTYTGDRLLIVGTDIWLPKADMPTARRLLAAAAVNGKIYAIGGMEVSYLAKNEEYDPATNSWGWKADMPTARGHLAAAAVNGKIYAIGGHDGTSYLATNEEYDPTTNTWATKADMPTARFCLAAAALNSKIYAIGGQAVSYLANNEEYDPATNTWGWKADMPTARIYLAAATANGKIYAIGGQAGSFLARNEEYDPTTNTWATKADMLTARGFLAAAAANGKIYAIGGHNGTSYLAKNEEYDPATNTWGWKAGMPTARGFLAAAALNGKIYAIGGYDVSRLATNEEYTTGVAYYLQRKD